MIKALLNGILSMVTFIVNLILTPINLLIENVFPDMSSAIATFNNFITSYVGGSISWFASILPPITRSIIVLYLTFLIGYYTIVWTYTLTIKIWGIIQKLKFW